MSILLSIKKLAERIPYPIGRWASYVPYSWRLGSTYTKYVHLIRKFESYNPDDKIKYLLNRLDSIVQYAQKNIPFYRELYGKGQIRIVRLDDFECLPVISRSQVRVYTQQTKGSMLLNTGGTSGEPLSFYVDSKAWAREWAHMHFIWGIKGYKPTDLMFTMLGKNLFRRFYKYNAVHNEFRLNPYMDAGQNINIILQLFETYPVSFFQGYPSSVYNFFKEIESVTNEKQRHLIQSKIRCCFLSSEYPMPYMTDYIRDVWALDYISWYGHSEMCILAYENQNKTAYMPLLTYGFSEVVDGILCGTSFNNYDMPLIRYSTGDRVEPNLSEAGFVESFVVSEGRTGDYVLDKSGRKVTLTAFIFGRHHLIFNIADYVQVYQGKMGYLKLFIVLKSSHKISELECEKFFDIRNADFYFSFQIVEKPYLTRSGKLKLLLSDEDVCSVIVKNA